MSIKVAEILAAGIIKEMEAGIIPWDKSFNDPGKPYNPTTDKDYQGFNSFILIYASIKHGGNQFLGLKQAGAIGGKLKDRGDYYNGIPIYCPIFKKMKDKSGDEVSKLISFRFSTVYPLSFFEGINPAKLKIRDVQRVNNPTQAVEDFIALRSPSIKTGPCPCYIPAMDEIRMPERNSYLTSDHYDSTIMHELGHWTGAKDRMNRSGVVETIRFGTEKYGKEELVAEMFSFFARNFLGIEAEPDNAERKNRIAYLAGWISKIKAEPQILFSAASEAERALNWYLKMEEQAETEEDVA